MLNLSTDSENSQPAGQDVGYVAAPTAVSLPKGGGAIQGIGEKFDVNPVTGTGSFSIPIAVSPGRSGFSPQLTLSYDSGGSNSSFGLGWSLGVPSIRRKTQKGLPRYRDAENSDVFLLSGAEDLVPTLLRQGDAWVEEIQSILVPEQVIDSDLISPEQADSILTSYPALGAYTVQRYRPRVEGLFARIERWQHRETGDVHWRSVTRDNITSVYGKTRESRIAAPDIVAPDLVADSSKQSRVFEWLLCESYDDKGNVILYEYKQENTEAVNPALVQEKHRLVNAQSDTQRYLKRIFYGNRTPHGRDDWLFQVVFDYGEHGSDAPNLDDSTLERLTLDIQQATDTPTPDETQPWQHRPDAFSTCRAGFEIRTQRLCRRVLMFHQFEGLGPGWTLVRSTDFRYDKHPVVTYLSQATQTGYTRIVDTQTYQRRTYPPLALAYDRPQIDDTIQTVDEASLENLPIGLGDNYQWVDLDGEGIAGILTEQAEGWFYKANRGEATFAPVQRLAARPSVSNLQDSQQQLVDLAGDGQQDLVLLAPGLAGFYERGHRQDWDLFKPFESVPNLDWTDPNLRWIDLNGDGHADLLLSEHEVFVWYPSRAGAGFDAAVMTRKTQDEEQGPTLVFSDVTQSVYLSDMTGDGLSDIVRIRNGAVCYWPNLGYGRFGAKVTMGQAPYFDHPDLFEQQRIRLGDIDGSGTTDILYLGREGVSLWFNQSGNSWSEAQHLSECPQVDSLAAVQLIDLLGNGTACLVWSSSLPAERHQRMQYIDLMGGQKPHLLRLIQNNLGAETRLHYAPSTQFYLADKQTGTPWLTKLPFPVQVVSRVETVDRISGNRFVSTYRYRHGYFDGAEREFRGFGYVEQLDTESFAAFQETGDTNAMEAAFHVPPVLTKTWFHTGFYRNRAEISRAFAAEYYRLSEPGDAASDFLLPDTILPAGLTRSGGAYLPQNLTPSEASEACRALKGSVLRQEIYALDDTAKSPHPYRVSEQNYQIRWLQPRQHQRDGVFVVTPREGMEWVCDRNPTDPRITHQFTLDVDEFGTVLKSAAVAYPRREAALPSHPQVRAAQSQTHITYTEVDVIHWPEALTFYRVGLPFETRTYEITGLSGSQPFTLEGLLAEIQAADEISYEVQSTPGTLLKRLVERDRIQYLRNDLTGPLPLGQAESLALPFETYRLAFTPALLTRIYGNRVNNTLLENEGRYVLQGGLWWLPSGRQIFDADHFYLPVQTRDPFNQVYTTTYDDAHLLTVQTEDPLGNQILIDNDYRVLQPFQITDANGNRTQVIFDSLGMVVGRAAIGDNAEGDSLDNFQPDLDEATLQAHIQDPLTNPHEILGSATTRLVYDLWAYYRSQQTSQDPVHPGVVYTLVRETHASELSDGEQSAIQHSFIYSDGFGREIQVKAQAEPGLAPERDESGVLRCDQNLVYTESRWVGTGRTVFNNKGKPVKQYEPFFSPTHRYESELGLAECGVTPIIFYDPIQRVVATLNPNHTYSKVVLNPWQQTPWDSNDTVLQTPAEDPDVGSYFSALASDAYLPTWHQQRLAGGLGLAEQSAAQKTAAHANTPSVVHLDTLGRPLLTLEDNGEFGQHETRMGLDIEGHQLYVIDARGNPVMVNAVVTRDNQGVPLRDDRGNPIVETTAYNLLGHPLYSLSADAGERWTLNNVAGNPIRGWDSRGFVTRLAYDALQRPTHLFVRNGESPEILAERTVYGDRHPEATQRNLRGQVFKQFDAAGCVTHWEFDFKNNLLRSSRQLGQSYRGQIDWSVVSALTEVDGPELILSANPLLEQPVFDVISSFDALNRPIRVIGPDGSETHPRYNAANLLEAMQVQIHGEGDFVPFVTNIDYNEKAQRTLIEYGNGVRTEYTYDRATFRLTRLLTTRVADSARLQDLQYAYDPVGNLTSIRDAAQQILFFNGEVVSPHTDYVYDPLYQLRQAHGREHMGQNSSPNPDTRSGHDDFNDAPRRNLAHPHNGQAMRNYTENYTYDPVGNLLSMAHQAADDTWTRRYRYAAHNNRLEATSLPGDDPLGPYSAQYAYDAHGNMIRMPHLPTMTWDFKDQLQASSQQVVNNGGTPETTYYVYDAAGQRVRKVTERQAAPGETPTRLKERIYLGGVEIYREYGSGAVTLERETLHILDDKQRVALVETQTLEVGDGVGPDLPVSRIRYQLNNHLGSASLELDPAGAIISYEEYHPYGTTAYQAGRSVAEVSLKRYRHSGKERDGESGLNYHGARYYIPWLGRWLSSDPTGLGDGVNVYAYARNNPATFVDLSGNKTGPPKFDPRFGQIFKLEAYDDAGVRQAYQNADMPTEGLLLPQEFDTVFSAYTADAIYFGRLPKDDRDSEYGHYTIPESKGASKNEVVLNVDMYFAKTSDGTFTFIGDPTEVFETLLHEGLHARAGNYRDEGGTEIGKPTNTDFKQLDNHEYMAERGADGGGVDFLYEGMKNFDKLYGLAHSDEWYIAMIFKGSLGDTQVYEGFSPEFKAKLKKILENEKVLRNINKTEALLKDAQEKGYTSSAKKYQLTLTLLRQEFDQALYDETRTASTKQQHEAVFRELPTKKEQMRRMK